MEPCETSSKLRRALRTAAEVDVGGCEIVQRFVVATVIVMVDEASSGALEPALDLAWVIGWWGFPRKWRLPCFFEPLGKPVHEVGRAVVAGQTWPPIEIGVIQPGG